MQIIQNPRIQGIIQRMFGLKGRVVAPTVSPEVQCVAVVDSFDRSGIDVDVEPRRCIATAVNVNGNAAFRIHFFIYNPANSGVVSRITRYMCHTSVAGTVMLVTSGNNDPTGGSGPGSTQFSNRQTQGAPATVTRNVADGALVIGLTAVQRVAPTEEAWQPFDFVIGPNQFLGFEQQGVGVLTAWMGFALEETTLGART